MLLFAIDAVVEWKKYGNYFYEISENSASIHRCDTEVIMSYQLPW
jgi:hypothetical protein